VLAAILAPREKKARKQPLNCRVTAQWSDVVGEGANAPRGTLVHIIGSCTAIKPCQLLTSGEQN